MGIDTHHTPVISNRGLHAPASPIRKLAPFAEQAKARGITVHHLNIGDPDFAMPAEVKAAWQSLSLNTRHLPYTDARGLQSTVNAWVAYYKTIGISLRSDDLLVTTGGSEALLLAAAATLDPGDEFIVFEPYYANYAAIGNMVSATPVPVSLGAHNGYHLPTDAEIAQKITPRTKAIFFTNPNNPTGTVFSNQEVQRIIGIAKDHGLFLISDEAYYGISFDGQQCHSVLQVAQGNELQNVIVVDSVSKKLSACGARIGVIASKNTAVMDAVLRFAQGRLSAPYIEQKIIEPLLTNPTSYVAMLAAQYKSRRDTFMSELEKTLSTTLHRPEGAFYIMATLPVDDTDIFAKWLLTDFSDNNETVMISPGSGFYATPGKGKQEARIAYVLNEQSLTRAAQLLGMAVKAYNTRGQHGAKLERAKQLVAA